MASIKITLLGHASFRFEPDTGEVVYFDPWLDGNPACDLSVADVKEADVVVATHGHNDHIGDSFAICKQTGAIFVGNYELCLVAAKSGLEFGRQAIPMNPGGTAVLPGLKITATQAFHSLSMSANQSLGDVPGDLYFRPDGAVCGMVLQFENGITVYDTSDTTVFGDMALISQMYGPQVAILPVGGKFTMGVREAARAASLIRPDVVIPCHYGEAVGQPADIDALAKGVSFLSANTRVVKLEPGQALSYTASHFGVG
ncbi:MAG: metal-dependent hydrolase [bacterium]|nr:metal-dependent hydrolase [bacterium]